MLISESYRSLNRKLHETREDYGNSGKQWAPVALQLAQQLKARSILDYGCGKQTFAKEYQRLTGSAKCIVGYDPAIPGLDAPPEPADIVVCGDVLEHIEPDCLDEVLADIRRCTKWAAVFVVNMQPSTKHLEDGRNAHLIVEDFRWWLWKLLEYFDLIQVNNHFEDVQFVAIMKPRRSNGQG